MRISIAPDFTVTGECCSVNRKLETAIQGRCCFQWDAVGVRRFVVRCFVVSLMQVWSRSKTSCACEGLVCHSFAK